MNSGKIHWDLLRTRLLILLASGVLAALLVTGSNLQFHRLGDACQRDLSALRQVVLNYRDTLAEEALYADYIDRFESLVRAGYIGAEQRLLWVEAIRQINDTLRLPVLQYTIDPRTEVVSASDAITVYESTMSLTLGLLHGGDLYRFFAALEQRTPGPFVVRVCDLQKMPGAQLSDPDHANINAICQLSWYSIELAAEQRRVAP